MRHYIDKPDTTIQKIVRATFPNYRGKKFCISDSPPSRLNSYWDGGSRDYYAFYHLDTGKTYGIGSNHPCFEANNPRELETLPERIVVVEHSILQGKDMGITIYANKIDMTPMLPPKQEYSEHEITVLFYTSALKNSYGGETNIRFTKASRTTGITQDEWNTAKQSCIIKGLLKKNGGITPNGRNAIEDYFSRC